MSRHPFRALTQSSLRALAIILFAGCATAATPAPVPSGGGHGETIVYIVRHAEKSAENPANPDLTTAGFVRADSLASQLKDAGINAILITKWKRNIETAEPLAKRRGITPEVVSLGNSIPEHIDSVVAAVHRHTGSRILIVGHSNTVARIAEALGAPHFGDLCDSEYSDLIILSIHRSTPVGFIVDSYGPADPPGDGTCTPIRSRKAAK